ncbi:MAG TPA: hypothetical protein VFB39_15305, partial [Solirubrobacteraceae bacterium]|nr:hypothetical protein [Solirubrobacteraceae bacterium]
SPPKPDRSIPRHARCTHQAILTSSFKQGITTDKSTPEAGAWSIAFALSVTVILVCQHVFDVRCPSH